MLPPSSPPFSCAPTTAIATTASSSDSGDDSPLPMASIATLTNLQGAVPLIVSFQNVTVGEQLVSAFGGQCGDYLWIEVSGCISRTVYT